MASKKRKKPEKEEKKEDEFGSRMGKQLTYVLIGMAVLFLILIGIFLIRNANNGFTFLGLKWDKQMFGEIPVYHTKIVTNMNGTLLNQELYLRNNPKSLALANFPVQYKKNKDVLISINDSVGACTEGTVAFTDLGKFLASIGITAKLGLADENLSEEMNMPFFNCDNATTNTVLLFEGGDGAKIENEGNCYIVSVNNCEMIKATETVIVNTIATARGYINETA